ncbi:MAG: Rieske 2Fe-2S domain-containing protein [Candidatus Dadabacteria bacterium]|nr:Rieske 2Fe-2S domain-containing protein [Candidatus Dadabacteria bacterium]
MSFQSFTSIKGLLDYKNSIQMSERLCFLARLMCYNYIPVSELGSLRKAHHKDETVIFKAATTDEIPPGGRKVVTAGLREIVIFNLEGQYYALCNLCPHGGFRFSNGPLDGEGVICPGHFWKFNVKTGECMSLDFQSAETYRVIVDGDDIFIEIHP